MVKLSLFSYLDHNFFIFLPISIIILSNLFKLKFENNMSFEKLEVFGNVPLPRFGHSITPYAETKICLFGGATGTTGQFSITDNTYTLDLNTKFWKKV